MGFHYKTLDSLMVISWIFRLNRSIGLNKFTMFYQINYCYPLLSKSKEIFQFVAWVE